MLAAKKHAGGATAGKFELIQVLRFIAALAVVVCHSAFYSKERLDSGTISYNLGANGVPLFFVISGFVMMIAAEKMHNADGAWKLFAIRRIVRIVPLYWFATSVKLLTLLASASLVLHAQVDWLYIVKSYFFVPAINVDNETKPLLAVGWTLLFEMFFYAVFTLALLVRVDAVKFTAPILVTLAVASVFKSDAWNVALAFYADPIVLNFLWGMLTARLMQRSVLVERNTAIVILLLSLGYLFFPRFPEYGNTITYGLASFLVVYCCASLEKTVNFTMPQGLVFLGAASYSIYLFHPLTAPVVPEVFKRLGIIYSVPSVIGSILVALCVGAFMYRFVECPLTDKLNHYVKQYFSSLTDFRARAKSFE
ncbi:acyltransferase [Pseudomonas frederiksbergensis]|nr:acyltransferase [Pseudomonas frederiksbergensis]